MTALRRAAPALPLAAALLAAVLLTALAQDAQVATAGVRRDLRPASFPADTSVMAESAAYDEEGDDVLTNIAAGLAAATPQALAAAAAADFGLGPVLCNTLDCPSYRVLERYDGTELRRYDPATFSSTVLSLDDEGSIEKAAVIGFHRLFKYILGDNEDSKKVSMTAPVLYGFDVDEKASSHRDVRFRDRFSVSFFVPFKYQDEPPHPTNPDVFLVDVKEKDIYVRSFDGYATGARIHRVASSFLRDLYDDGHKVDCRTVYIAQYSPPFQPVFRYNEVWVLRRRGRATDAADADADAAAGDDFDAAAACDWLKADDASDAEEVVSEPQQRRAEVERDVWGEVAALVSEARRVNPFELPIEMQA